jgi:hypothetical protein
VGGVSFDWQDSIAKAIVSRVKQRYIVDNPFRVIPKPLQSEFMVILNLSRKPFAPVALADSGNQQASMQSEILHYLE